MRSGAPPYAQDIVHAQALIPQGLGHYWIVVFQSSRTNQKCTFCPQQKSEKNIVTHKIKTN